MVEALLQPGQRPAEDGRLPSQMENPHRLAQKGWGGSEKGAGIFASPSCEKAEKLAKKRPAGSLVLKRPAAANSSSISSNSR